MLQSYSTSNNGISSFAEASPDYELAPIGLASFQDQAKKLADYGRNGDIYVVHAAEGETVIPLEVLDANPKVKELLFNQMEEMGLDPQEFVVGNELNSINPVTGLPEFFFKSVFRAVKKVVKKVAKVVKKAAPIVLPIAAAAFGVPFLGPSFGIGTFGASFLGGGIGTLAGGGSLKDALKSGLLSGGLSVASSGIGSLIKGGNIGDAITSSFTGATPVYNTAGTQIGTQYAASPFADVLGSSPGRVASAAASKAQFKDLLGGKITDAFTGEGTLLGPEATRQAPGFVPAKTIRSNISQVNPSAGEFLSNRVPRDLGPGVQVASSDSSRLPALGTPKPPPIRTENQATWVDYYDKELGRLTEEKLSEAAGKSGFSDFVFGPKYTSDDVLKAANISPRNVTPEDYETLRKTAAGLGEGFSAGPLRKYGPLAAIGAGAADLGGAFDVPEEEQPKRSDLEGFTRGPTGAELLAANPDKYLVQDLDPYKFVPRTLPAADGGMAHYPRRELLVEGPGTERSDDIPAMLSDGEFVWNARAVRGADPSGKGNRYAGAQNLYNMMRNFEMKA